MIYNLLTITLVIVAVLLIGLILLQQGKGADAGAAFGSGSSGTVFGAAGAGGFLSRLTWTLAGLFFLLALGMAYMARHSNVTPQSVVEQAQQQAPAAATKPATPSPAPAAGTH